jgi:hypothetical protein
MGFAEGSYRANGFAKGYLQENEYVSFSEQSYALGVCDYCSGNTDDPFCFGGPAKGTTSDGRGEWLYYLREQSSCSILPDAVCPYQNTDEGQYECPGREEALERNPISFTVTSIESYYSVDSIRNALFIHRTPLLWSHAVYEATYTIPCNNTATEEGEEGKEDGESSPLSTTQMCTDCLFPCPEEGKKDQCCAKFVLPGYGNDGIFSLHNEPYIHGGHAMLLVGYNDQFRVDNGVPGDRKAKTIGGFIIKNRLVLLVLLLLLLLLVAVVFVVA